MPVFGPRPTTVEHGYSLQHVQTSENRCHDSRHTLATFVLACMSVMLVVCSLATLMSFPLCTIEQSRDFAGDIAMSLFCYREDLRLGGMTMTYVWYESYKAVALETDWTKMHELIQSAESKINDRKRVLSLDHGGTPGERQAIANALNALDTLRTEVGDWQSRQAAETERRSGHL
jgi:hypothetical protein